MAASSACGIPVVDFSCLSLDLADDQVDESSMTLTAREMISALSTTGFVYLSNTHFPEQLVHVNSIDVKRRFFVFLFRSRFLRFLTFFSIFQTFFIFKNVGKVQSGKQINRKHFQNNSNEIDL